MRVLGIETSCDETGVAVYDSARGLLSHRLHSQVALHRAYGGVVPELASRDHVRRLLPLVREALAESESGAADIDGIAYTAGPGLIGALLVGVGFSQALAQAWGKPALGIHHLEGHLLAPMLETDAPRFPFLALLVSGGHTQLVDVRGLGDYQILGDSLDDAAGEAFDKTAKLLGLPYPGGAALARLAEAGRPGRYVFPRPMLDRPGLDFSFSGLKTAALVALRGGYSNVANRAAVATREGSLEQATRAEGVRRGGSLDEAMRAERVARGGSLDEAMRADVARGFEDAVVDTLAEKTRRALHSTGRQALVVAGGVGANVSLRLRLGQVAAANGARLYVPRPEFCTDNGAMIALAGALRLQGGRCDLGLGARARWEL